MCDYEEMYYDYVPDEVTVKISDVIKEELNNRLGSDLDELKRLRESDKEKQNKIYELQREVKNIKQEYDQKLKNALLEKEREVKRKIFQGFTIKDKVFFIDSRYINESCPTCEKGKIKVTINEREEKVQCPHCNGQGEKHIWTAYVRQGEISQVDFKTWYDESEKCTESYFYINTDKTDRKDSSKQNIKNIFKTEEEAVKECELRNNKEK
jgi:hypothetical protein